MHAHIRNGVRTISVSHSLKITPSYSIALPRTCGPNAALPEPWTCLLRSLHSALRAPLAGVHTSAFIWPQSGTGGACATCNAETSGNGSKHTQKRILQSPADHRVRSNSSSAAVAVPGLTASATCAPAGRSSLHTHRQVRCKSHSNAHA